MMLALVLPCYGMMPVLVLAGHWYWYDAGTDIILVLVLWQCQSMPVLWQCRRTLVSYWAGRVTHSPTDRHCDNNNEHYDDRHAR